MAGDEFALFGKVDLRLLIPLFLWVDTWFTAADMGTTSLNGVVGVYTVTFISVGCASDLCKVCILSCPLLELRLFPLIWTCPCPRFGIVLSWLGKSLCTAVASDLSLLIVLKYLELGLALIYCETSSLLPSSSLDASLSSVLLFKLPFGLPTCRFAWS